MLTQAVVLLAFCSSSPYQEPTAKDLIQKMLAVYHGAKTLTGTVQLTVTAEGAGSATLNTNLQFERPAKLYLFQKKQAQNPDPEQPSQWLVTSDGEKFSYQIPNDRYPSAPGLRLVEPVVNPRVNVNHTIGSIYAASSKSIGDRSMPLDIAIAERNDLVYRRGQWMTYGNSGSKDIRGKTGYIVGGKFRMYASGPETGTYQMVITSDGELLQYVEKVNVATSQDQNPNYVTVVSQWDVDLKINGAVNAALFKVVVK
jgi:hypothetical protein